ncbi:MAG: tautomerase family protein [bacterium]|nr:tautomerase family protein [bacterium]
MPTVQIALKKGYTADQKRSLVSEATKTLCEVLKIAPDGVRILIRDLAEEDYAVAGELWLDHRDGGGQP